GFFVLSLLFAFLSLQLPAFTWLAALAISLFIGSKGNAWKGVAVQNRGYEYVGALTAKNGADAVAKVVQSGGVIPSNLKAPAAQASLVPIPKSTQGLFAVAGLTWKAALRFR